MLVFVYGSLKSDGDNSDKMSRACGKFQFSATTLKEYFKGQNGFFEYLIDNSENNVSPIEGEVYEVPESFIEYLDAFEDPLERKVIQVQSDNNIYDIWCYFCEDLNEC